MQKHVPQDGKRREYRFQGTPNERSSMEMREDVIERFVYGINRIELGEGIIYRLRAARQNNVQVWANSAQVQDGAKRLHHVCAKLRARLGHIVVAYGCSGLRHGSFRLVARSKRTNCTRILHADSV